MVYIDNVNITNDLSTQQIVKQEVSVFPNPLVCSQQLTISGLEEQFEVRIRDLNGKTVYFNEKSSSLVNLPSTLRDGQYIITIETESHIWNKKLVILNENWSYGRNIESSFEEFYHINEHFWTIPN